MMTRPDDLPAPAGLPAEVPDERPDGPALPGWAVAAVERVLRIAGGLVAVAVAVVSALVEIFYAPLRVGGVLIGASVMLAMVVNFWLPRYTVAVTGSGWAALLPALVWFGLMLAAADPRTEGDLLLRSDNWVGTVMILVGSVAFAVGGYGLLLRRA